MKKRKIIINTDPGVDDALAITMALQNPIVEILGIVSTFGNVRIEKTTANALRILEYFGRNDIVVVKGSSCPLQGRGTTSEDVHGTDGLGDISLPSPKKKPLRKNAVEFFKETIEENKNNIDIVALGPLTDIAKLFIAYPEVIKKINNLYIMGGTFRVTAVTKYEEFNFYNDPLAVKIVLNSSVTKYLVPLDVTNTVFLNEEQIQQLYNANTKGAKLLYQISRFWKKNLSAKEEFILWDPVGIGPFFQPELYTFRKVALDISLDSKTKGKLFIIKSGPKTTFLAKKVAVDKFLLMFEQMICK